MDRRVKQYIFDIQNSIDAVESYLKTVSSFDDYINSKMLRRAIEREIEIIGEAMNRILKLDPSISISNSRRIVDTRNKIIHGYDEVDDVVIYVIATKHLKDLRQEIEGLI